VIIEVNTTYSIGDVVYRKIDPEVTPGLVTGIRIRVFEGIREAGIEVEYLCSFPDDDKCFYEVELSRDPVYNLTSEEKDAD
jgi:hypothetical protein